jgi:hypothetical protein
MRRQYSVRIHHRCQSSGTDVPFIPGQVIDLKARVLRALLLAAPAWTRTGTRLATRFATRAGGRLERELADRLGDDDEGERAGVDGEVERRVGAGHERPAGEEDGEEDARDEADPAAREGRVRLVERAVQEADRCEAEHRHAHAWWVGGLVGERRACMGRGAHRCQSTSGVLGRFLWP